MSKLVYTKGKEYHIGVGAGDVGRYVIRGAVRRLRNISITR